MTLRHGRTIAVVAGALSLIAWRVAADQLTLKPDSRLWVEGTSTVRGFSCKAPVLDATITTAEGDPVAAVLAGKNGVTTVKLSVPVDKMDCGNGTMNGHMQKALKMKEFPAIAFQLENYALTKGDTALAGSLHGSLTIGGVAKAIVLPVTLKAGPDGALRVAGVYELNMRDYQLQPPSLMMGTLKVRENVKVNFDLLLKP
jgi:polyisoprenoid-binding protein YceI